MNKKKGEGQNVVLQSIIGIVLAAIIIAAIVNSSFLKGFLGFFSSSKEQATMDNFRTITEILKIKDTISTTQVYTIGEDYILVGFNKDDKGSVDECQYEKVPRPASAECNGNACLCLYKVSSGRWYQIFGTDDDFEGNVPMVCSRIEADYVFTLDYAVDKQPRYTTDEPIYKNIIGPRMEISSSRYKIKDYSYASLFIYGECGDWGSNAKFGIQKIYIERIYDAEQNKAYVLIADQKNSQDFVARLARLP